MFFTYDEPIYGGNVAVIKLHGPITVAEESGFGSSSVSSEAIIAELEKAEDTPGIKAIILDINSPGGSGVAADEISQKIKSMNITTVAVIRDMGASAAYWIASSTDYIYANRMSITGSIGVIGSYLDFSGLIKDYNVTYRRYVSGELKDMGSPFKEPSEEETALYQSIIDKMKSFFVQEVALNRDLPMKKVEELATGQIYLGVEAKELGLIDETGTRQDAVDYIERKLNITASVVEFKQKKGLGDLLSEFSVSKSFINQGPIIGLR
jgi:protease-4